MARELYDLDAAMGNTETDPIIEDPKTGDDPIVEDPKTDNDDDDPIVEDPKTGDDPIVEDPKTDDDLPAEVTPEEIVTEQFGMSVAEVTEKLAEVEDLKKKLSEGPSFTSDFQKKLFKFVTEKFDGVEDLNGAVQTYVNLVTMDVAKMDDESVLREAFLLENSDMPRDKALAKFKRDYGRKFVSQTEDEEEQEDLDFDRSKEAKKARKELEAKQTELKPAAKQPAQEYKVPEIVSKAIETNKEAIKKSFEGFDGIVLQSEDKADTPFKFVLNKEQKKEIEARLLMSISRPDMYDEKGEFSLGFDAVASRDALTRAVYGKELLEAYGKHRESLGFEKRVREISGDKPDRKSGQNGKPEPKTMDDAWAQAAADRKAKKN